MKKLLPVILILAIVGVGGWLIFGKGKNSSSRITPTPTETPAAEQLAPDKQPRVSLQFSSDAHYVTVKLSNLNADVLEYNLIYDAIVKKSKINSGVSGGGKISGKSEFTVTELTSHFLTNVWVIQKFLPARIEIEGEKGTPGKVTVKPG